jgi:hypothetical protein
MTEHNSGYPEAEKHWRKIISVTRKQKKLLWNIISLSRENHKIMAEHNSRFREIG